MICNPLMITLLPSFPYDDMLRTGTPQAEQCPMVAATVQSSNNGAGNVET